MQGFLARISTSRGTTSPTSAPRMMQRAAGQRPDQLPLQILAYPTRRRADDGDPELPEPPPRRSTPRLLRIRAASSVGGPLSGAHGRTPPSRDDVRVSAQSALRPDLDEAEARRLRSSICCPTTWASTTTSTAASGGVHRRDRRAGAVLRQHDRPPRFLHTSTPSVRPVIAYDPLRWAPVGDTHEAVGRSGA